MTPPEDPEEPEGRPDYRVYRSRRALFRRRGGDDGDDLGRLRGNARQQQPSTPGDGPKRHDGLTQFLVDMKTPGITVNPIMQITGQKEFNEVVFKDVFLPDDYMRDQQRAGHSGFHIASFFQAIQPLLAHAKQQGRRCFLLAHSMGNYALQAAVDSWFTHDLPATILFDDANRTPRSAVW